jgi:DNA-binding NtrC family response regulator
MSSERNLRTTVGPPPPQLAEPGAPGAAATFRTLPTASDLDHLTSELNLAHCKLVVLSGSQRGREVTLAAEVLRIGKGTQNELCLPDETVSRNHCEIRLDPHGYLLCDLGSTNGTYLDGAKIREAYLRPGSVITVGPVQVRFVPLEERVKLLPSDRDRLGDLRGRSLKMREIYAVIERIAPTDATVLLQGETGVGKDLVARTLHSLSPRRDQPFVVVDCGALSPGLVESELFGHEKGAFTDAIQSRAGAFEVAQGGTLFLDEVGELPLDLQPKLLRALESREIRVGGLRPQKVDIRVVAATKRNLRTEVERGHFRQDLFFRLAVVVIHVPSLRDRREDIPQLVDHMLDGIAALHGTRPHLPPRARQILQAHDWPGNVRELRNVIERAASLGDDAAALGLIDMDGVGAPERDLGFDPTRSHAENKERWNERFEKLYLRWILDRASGNVSRAAREADMDRKYLHRLLKRYGLSG